MHKRLQITEWLALFGCAPLQAQVSSHIESDSLHLGSIDIVTETGDRASKLEPPSLK